MPVSEHHSSWRGAAVEHLVAATFALAGRGRINVAQTLWDSDGVDLLLEGAGPELRRLRIQVKSIDSSNVNVTKRRRAVSLVRQQTFEARDDTYLLFVVVDLAELTFEKSWLVPSLEFEALTRVNARGVRRFVDGVSSQRSKWTRFRHDSRRSLVDAVMTLLEV